MDNDEAVVRGMTSLETEVNHSLTWEQLQAIRRYFYLMFGAGYDEGTRQLSKCKPIVMMKKGVVYDNFPSIKIAAHKLKLDPTSISRACRGQNRTYKGFDWRFEGKEDEWEYKR